MKRACKFLYDVTGENKTVSEWDEEGVFIEEEEEN
jgi:hypothetical protein